MRKTVIGIDPGTTHSAWVAFNGERVTASGYEANESVRNEVQREAWPRNARIACEQFEARGMAVGQDSLDTVWWSGRFAEALAPVTMVKRSTVKLHLCGSNRAKDANVRQALLDRFGSQGTKAKPGALYGISKHKWAALAVAVTYYDQIRGVAQ